MGLAMPSFGMTLPQAMYGNSFELEIDQIHAKLKALEFLYYFWPNQHIGDPDVIFRFLNM